MKKLEPKISIIGCGNVGVRFAYALIIKGLARQVVLVDINKKLAEGEAMDLSHGAPYVRPVNIIAGDYKDVKNSDIIVITAGRNQKKGETRIDLIKGNIELFKKIIPEIVKISPDSILLIVSNPVDILSYVTYKISKLDVSKVIGSGTALDTARFRFELAQHCEVDPRNVHAYIMGEHGDSEFPVWSSAMIGGVLVKDYCPICDKKDNCNSKEVLDNLFTEVRDSAYEIIDRKGETSYGIGLALTRIVQAVVRDENTILPVSTFISDYYDTNDVYLGVPAIVNKDGLKKIIKIKLNEKEQQSLKESSSKLKKLLKDAGFE